MMNCLEIYLVSSVLENSFVFRCYSLDELVVEDDYIQEARQMKKDGKSLREIEKELNSKGYEVSKSSIQRRLD